MEEVINLFKICYDIYRYLLFIRRTKIAYNIFYLIEISGKERFCILKPSLGNGFDFDMQQCHRNLSLRNRMTNSNRTRIIFHLSR